MSDSSRSCWTCLTCTFAGNPFLFLACSVCNEPRQQIQQQQQQHYHHPHDVSNNSSNNTNSSIINNNKSSSTLTSNTKQKASNSSSSSSGNNYNSSTTAALQHHTTTTTTTVSTTAGRKVPKLDHQQQKAAVPPPVPAAAVPGPVPASQTTDEDITIRRRPPLHSTIINNLSDRQYCCVWNVEVFTDGYRPDIARTMLARIARHVNPILRERGWRVKRLLESCSTQFLGCCYHNGRADADAASTNIKLNLRVVPDKQCQQFYSFSQVLSVMLHEIAHTSIGLEDIHPPAFFDLLNEIKQQYRTCLSDGQVALETDAYGCDESIVTKSGHVMTIAESAMYILGPDQHYENNVGDDTNNNSGTGECGVSKQRNKSWRRRQQRRSSSSYGQSVVNNKSKEKRRPMLKGAKMIDGRTKEGKRVKGAKENATPRELAARAAVARLGCGGGENNISTGSRNNNINNASKTAAAPSKTMNASSNNRPPAAAVGRGGGNKNKSLSSDDSDNDETDDDDDDDDDDDLMVLHELNCPCRCCDWDKKFGTTTFLPTSSSSSTTDSAHQVAAQTSQEESNGRGQKRAADAKPY